jgi:hypothetical protein
MIKSKTCNKLYINILQHVSRHLKNIVIRRLESTCVTFVPSSQLPAPHTKGVRYLDTVPAINALWGAMNDLDLGRKRRKHIIVRRVHNRNGLLQLYTYHFPKSWSAGCVANRELIKTAQRLAHQLEHDHSYAALEWRIRFMNHYFNVFRCGAKPEPGMKAYSRFYQYTYVAIYRQLKAAQQQPALEPEQIAEPTLDPQTNRYVINPFKRKKSSFFSCTNANFVVPLHSVLDYHSYESKSIVG